jgi:hypothetical protein
VIRHFLRTRSISIPSADVVKQVTVRILLITKQAAQDDVAVSVQQIPYSQAQGRLLLIRVHLWRNGSSSDRKIAVPLIVYFLILAIAVAVAGFELKSGEAFAPALIGLVNEASWLRRRLYGPAT